MYEVLIGDRPDVTPQVPPRSVRLFVVTLCQFISMAFFAMSILCI